MTIYLDGREIRRLVLISLSYFVFFPTVAHADAFYLQANCSGAANGTATNCVSYIVKSALGLGGPCTPCINTSTKSCANPCSGGTSSPGVGYTCPTASQCVPQSNGSTVNIKTNTYNCVPSGAPTVCMAAWVPPANCPTLQSCPAAAPSPGGACTCATGSTCTQVTNGTTITNGVYSCVSTSVCTKWNQPTSCPTVTACSGVTNVSSPGAGWVCSNSCQIVTSSSTVSSSSCSYNCAKGATLCSAWTPPPGSGYQTTPCEKTTPCPAGNAPSDITGCGQPKHIKSSICVYNVQSTLSGGAQTYYLCTPTEVYTYSCGY